MVKNSGWGTFYTDEELDLIRKHKKMTQAKTKAAVNKRGIKIDPNIAKAKTERV